MDFREHCISSVFLHVIAVLLAAVVSQQPPAASGVLTISLATETVGRSSPGAHAKAEETQVAEPELPVSSEEETVHVAESPDDADARPEEKPEPVKESGETPVAAQPADAAPPAPGQDMMQLAKLHHAYVIHTRAFVGGVSQSIEKALHKEIETDFSGGLEEGTAEVTFYFDDKGLISEVWGGSESEKLQEVLGRLDWRSIPPPGAYRLKMGGLHVKIKIDGGKPTLFFSAL